MSKKKGVKSKVHQNANAPKVRASNAKQKKKPAMDSSFSMLDSLIRDAEGNYFTLGSSKRIGYMSLVSRLSTAMTAYMQADARQGLIADIDAPKVCVKFQLAQIDREKACIDEQLEALLNETLIFCGADAHMQPGYEEVAAIEIKELEKKFGPIKTLTKEQMDQMGKTQAPNQMM